MCYAFDFLSADAPVAARYADVLNRFAEAAPDGWACWAFSNHDVVRHATRLGLPEDGYKALLWMMLGLPGSVCLYQGEELGLPEADVAFEDLQDPYGIEFWPEFKGRDGCRTPMVWSSNAPSGGFSGSKPWLPVSDVHAALSVDAQETSDTSMLAFYRAALKLRRSSPALQKGSTSAVSSANEVIWLTRDFDGESYLVAVNLSADQQSFEVPAGDWTDAIAGEAVSGTTTLKPWQAVWAKKN
jgi:alpha-glucosidase